MNDNKITELLRSKGVYKPCPRCGQNSFSIVKEGYYHIYDNKNLAGTGFSIPIVVIGCDNCGYLMNHAASILDDESDKNV